MPQLFNPDELFSAQEKQELINSVADIKNSCIAEISCPYDLNLCCKKMQELINFRQAIEYHARNHINEVIYTRDGAHDACNMGFDKCVRYRHWLKRNKNNGR